VRIISTIGEMPGEKTADDPVQGRNDCEKNLYRQQSEKLACNQLVV